MFLTLMYLYRTSTKESIFSFSNLCKCQTFNGQYSKGFRSGKKRVQKRKKNEELKTTNKWVV